MIGAQSQFFQSKAFKSFLFALGAVSLAWLVSRWIIADDTSRLMLVAAAAIGIPCIVAVLNDWRRGLYAFLIWLVFEDLIRKYLGNNTAMFFAKDAIIAVTYAGMVAALRRRKLLTFRPPFLFWLGIFVWVGVLQVLNPNSPSIFYGLLGLKLYFYYVPLMFAGYALLRTEDDLYKILTLNLWIGLTVAGLGIAQSILGLQFLSPAESELAPELRALGHEVRESPLTHLRVERITSVFVSDGRFGEFLSLFLILALGAAAYFILRNKPGRWLVFPTLGVIVVATVMTGQRGPFMFMIANGAVLLLAFFFGAPWTKAQSARIAKAARRAVVFAAFAVVLMVIFYPDAVRARWAMYTETLSPDSSASELMYRLWDYPVQNLESAFNQGHWQLGYGIGTASLGAQYVSRVLGAPGLAIGSESGYGTLILEFCIIGPLLWTAWTFAVVFQSWKVVKKLKQTYLFPVGFAFFWYGVYLLIVCTFYGLDTYENYIMNAYFWLILGMLFRLPHLLAERQGNGKQALAAAH